MFAVDHLAFPCFDVLATLDFYTRLLGATLRHAQSGPAPTWNANEYLLLAFELPGGVVLDFFSFDGIARPTGNPLPKDIWHVALAVETRADVLRLRDLFAADSVHFWTETHETEDLHVYATDPNGVTIEIVAKEDGVRAREHDAETAKETLDRWLTARARR